MKKMLLSLCALFFCVYTYAQELPKIIPPSPEASSLNKFIETPVSHYTGLASIGVPFYTIQTKGIQIPIQLGYHSRGIQVAEIAPRVGLGWALSYGGAISRQTRGGADDIGYNYLHYAANGKFSDFLSDYNTRIDLYNHEAVAATSIDKTPDMFTLSAGNVNGKFVFNYQDQQPVLQGFDDVSISYERDNTGGKIISFIVKDPQGNTFYFGKNKNADRWAYDYETVLQNITVPLIGSPVFNSGAGDLYYNSWRLMEIETIYKEKIEFFYEEETTVFYRKSSDIKSPSVSDPGPDPDPDSSASDVVSIISKVSAHTSQLKKITFDKGYLEFLKSSTKRVDVTDGYTLNNIALFDKFDQKIKSYAFTYEYTTATNNQTVNWFLDQAEPEAYKRLFLKKIQETGIDNTSIPAYEFKYNDIKLPNRFSTSQDIWGYYNGANNGAFLMFFDYGNSISVDRTVNIEKAEAGLLKQITHPTSGVTKFTYEHNQGNPNSTMGIVTKENNPKIEKEIILTKNDFVLNGNSYDLVDLDIPKGKLDYYIMCVHPRDNDDTTTPDCIFSSFLLKSSDDINYNLMPIGETKSVSICYQGGGDKLSFRVFPSNLTNGSGIPLHTLSQYDFRISLKYKEPIADENVVLYGGGKRIKKIETFQNTSDTTPVTVKEYSYELPNSNKTSGEITGIPFYYTEDSNAPVGVNPCWTIVNKFMGPGSAFSTYQGNTIGYTHVTEFYGTKEANQGKTEYTFTYIPDGGGDYFRFPFHPSTDNEWLRGKQKKIVHYKRNGSTYTRVKQIEKTYAYAGLVDEVVPEGDPEAPLEIDGLAIEKLSSSFGGHISIDHSLTAGELVYDKTRTLFKLPLFIFTGANGVATEYKVYHFIGGTQDLSSTTTINYLNGEELTSSTTNFYNYDKHYQLSKTKGITSDAKSLFTKFSYFQELSPPNTVGQEIINQHRFTPYKTEQYWDVNNDSILDAGEKLSTQNTLYENFLGIYLPKKVQTSKGTASLEDRIVFHSYDDKGKPIEVSKKDGTHIVYIWGYNQTQPIAKIENATSEDVVSYISGLQTASNLDNDRTVDIVASNGTITYIGKEGELRMALKNLRNSLPNNAMMTSYTYDPLIGVTSVTDTRGRSVYYEYDSLNRLKHVKDHNGNILSKNEYNYKN